jgi:hypothetical protein
MPTAVDKSTGVFSVVEIVPPFDEFGSCRVKSTYPGLLRTTLLKLSKLFQLLQLPQPHDIPTPPPPISRRSETRECRTPFDVTAPVVYELITLPQHWAVRTTPRDQDSATAESMQKLSLQATVAQTSRSPAANAAETGLRCDANQVARGAKMSQNLDWRVEA